MDSSVDFPDDIRSIVSGTDMGSDLRLIALICKIKPGGGELGADIDATLTLRSW